MRATVFSANSVMKVEGTESSVSLIPKRKEGYILPQPRSLSFLNQKTSKSI